MISHRGFIPIFTITNKFIPYFKINKSEVNKIIYDIKVPKQYSGLLTIKENNIQSDFSQNEKIIDMKLDVSNSNESIEEFIKVQKSMYHYSIGYKLFINGKQINCKVLTNNNFNSKNFEKNFDYYINKYDFVKGIKFDV